MKLQLKVLQAGNGDSTLIRFLGDDKKYHNILIDCGITSTYKSLVKELTEIRERKEVIDLLIITHIDNDHIQGINKLISGRFFQTIIVKEYWFNFGEMISINNSSLVAMKEAVNLTNFLHRNKKSKWNKKPIVFRKTPYKFFGAKITVLSPTQKELSIFAPKMKKYLNKQKEEKKRETDISYRNFNIAVEPLESLAKRRFKESNPKRDVTNGTSIAILFEVFQKKFLLLSDSRPSVVINSLKNLGVKKLSVDIFKVAHHGSKFNTSNQLLDKIDSSNYIISTNGSISKHPHRETIARIIMRARKKKKNIKIIFNYPKREYEKRDVIILTKSEEKTYKGICNCEYHNKGFEETW